MKFCKLFLLLIALSVLILGAQSACNARCCDTSTLNTTNCMSDWSDQGGCKSCKSGGLVTRDYYYGGMKATIGVPGYPENWLTPGGQWPELGFVIDGPGSAFLATKCGCKRFTYDMSTDTWTCLDNSGIQLNINQSGNNTIITFPDGSQVNYGSANTSGRPTMPKSVRTIGGSSQLYSFNTAGSRLTGMQQDKTTTNTVDVYTYIYFDDDANNIHRMSVRYPDGKIRMILESDTRIGEIGADNTAPTDTTWINKYIVDPTHLPQGADETDPASYPDDYKAVTEYHYVNGTDESTISSVKQNGLTTEVTTNSTVVRDDLYNYYSSVTVEYTRSDDEEYKVTRITELPDPNEPYTPEADRKVMERWYDSDGLLYKVIRKWKENGTPHTTTTTYTRNDIDEPKGLPTNIKDDIDGVIVASLDYDYYYTNKSYNTSVDAIPYGTSGGTTLGNGYVRSIAVSGSSDSVSFSYVVGSDGIMTSNVKFKKDIRGTICKWGYDSDRRISDMWYGASLGSLNHVKSYTYNTGISDGGATDLRLKGFVSSETIYGATGNGQNITTSYHYSYFNNAGQDWLYCITTDGNGKAHKSTYNALNYLISFQEDGTDDNPDKCVSYVYDFRGRVTDVTFPKVGNNPRQSRHYSYDCCTLESATDENTNCTSYHYDARKRLDAVYNEEVQNQTETDPHVKFSYDYQNFGAITEMTTLSDLGKPRVTKYTYDPLSSRLYAQEHPEVEIGQNPKTTEAFCERYQYDLKGNVVAKLQEIIARTYDSGGQKTSETSTNLKVSLCEYDSSNRLQKVDYGAASSTWPVPTTDSIGSVDVNDPDLTYEYEGTSALITDVTEKMTDPQGAAITTTAHYTYDTLGRVKTYTPALPVNYGTIEYEWNNINRKTSMTVPTGRLDASGHQICQKFIYNYDGVGRFVSTDVQTVIGTGTSVPSFESVGTRSDLAFLNDVNLNRVRLTAKDGGVYYYVYDPTASVPAVVYEQGPTKRYINVREPNGSLVKRETYNADGSLDMTRIYHFDGLGNTVALTDESGHVTDTYTYNAFGDVTPNSTNETTDNPYQFVGKYGYYTHYQEYDPTTKKPTFNLLQVGARYYDPEIGRFTQMDPIRDGLNWYQYASGNPVNLIDPTGLSMAGDLVGGDADTLVDIELGLCRTLNQPNIPPLSSGPGGSGGSGGPGGSGGAGVPGGPGGPGGASRPPQTIGGPRGPEITTSGTQPGALECFGAGLITGTTLGMVGAETGGMIGFLAGGAGAGPGIIIGGLGGFGIGLVGGFVGCMTGGNANYNKQIEGSLDTGPENPEPIDVADPPVTIRPPGPPSNRTPGTGYAPSYPVSPPMLPVIPEI